MKEFKFTATMRSERIQPNEKFRKGYQDFRHDLMMKTSNPYPEIEVIIRVRDPRQEWIDKWYQLAMNAAAKGAVFFKFVKDGTVCIPLIASAKDYTTIAAPRKGDKYNQRTGIAVSYAKYYGEKIPEYI